jgi:two-component system response regulator HydG
MDRPAVSTPSAEPTVTRHRLLIVDDVEDFRELARDLLSDDYDVDACATPEEAFELLRHHAYHAIMLDLIFDPRHVKTKYTGHEALAVLRERHPEIPVLVVTSTIHAKDILQAYDLGAFHAISKDDFRFEIVCNLIEKAIANATFEQLVRYQRSLDPRKRGRLVYRSPAMEQTLARVDAFAPTDGPVLITGERGVGKDIIAEIVHAQSGRNGPLLALNVANIQESAFEVELFGVAGGVWTDVKEKVGLFEAAKGGSVFLDEIAALPSGSQARLLRAIEEKKIRRAGSNIFRDIDVRFIFANSQSLDQMVEQGTFRADLYDRIRQLRVRVPPLRERPEDVLEIAWHYLRLQRGKKRHFTDEALEALLKYDWPGNVRELKNVVFAAYPLAEHFHPEDSVLSLGDLYEADFPRSVGGGAGEVGANGVAGRDGLDRLCAMPIAQLLPYEHAERQILEALQTRCLEHARAREGQNIQAIADRLGKTRETIYQWMRKLGYMRAREGSADGVADDQTKGGRETAALDQRLGDRAGELGDEANGSPPGARDDSPSDDTRPRRGKGARRPRGGGAPTDDAEGEGAAGG